MNTGKVKIGFVAATLSLLMAYVTSATPIPLYDYYHRVNGVTFNDLAMTSVMYFIGAVSALLVFGRISNHLGRKPVAFMVFASGVIACLFLLNVDGPLPLIYSRLFLGAGCGLASSALSAYVIDTASESAIPDWLPATIVSNSPMVGLTIGAIGTGALFEYGPFPTHAGYVLALIGIAICAVLIFLSDETVARKSGLVASFRPDMRLPHAERHVYPVAAATFCANWGYGGFFQAYGPSIVAQELGSLNSFMAAVIFSSYLIPAAFGGAISARFTPSQSQRIGMLAFVLSLAGLTAAMYFSAIYLFLVMSACAGVAQGFVMTGSVRSMLNGVSPENRSAVFAIIFGTSYSTAAILSFVAGQMTRVLSLFDLTVCFVVLSLLVYIITLLFAREPKMQEAETHQAVS